MKKNMFLTLFIGTHIIGSIVYIHHHTRTMHQSYRNQKYQTYLEQLEQKKSSALQTLYAQRSPAKVTTFAHEKLGMKPLALAQLHRLEHDE